MTWMWRWPPWRRAKVHGAPDGAAAHLAELERRDPEVAQLNQELREMQRRNNFSGMVSAAIARHRTREGT